MSQVGIAITFFMNEFRVKFYEEFPDTTSVGACAVAAADAWKSMTDAEKAPNFAMADRALYRPPWAGPCNCNGGWIRR